MIAQAVFWPTVLGLGILGVGLVTYWHDVRATGWRDGGGLVALGPVFVAASIAAFAGEHFALEPALSQLVPKWMPGRLFIAYFVGVAHLAAALSFVARRYVRWSSISLACMFGLFVLLMDLPSAVTHPATRMFWILAAREGTFAIGALALYATMIRDSEPGLARTLSMVARLWTGAVLILYGVQHFLFPQFSPGVPSTALTATWVPFATALAYVTGFLLVAYGFAAFTRRYAAGAVAKAGLVILALTVVLYAPQFFLARDVSQQITAINFIFDTLLFAGTLLVVGNAIRATESREVVSVIASEPERMVSSLA